MVVRERSIFSADWRRRPGRLEFALDQLGALAMASFVPTIHLDVSSLQSRMERTGEGASSVCSRTPASCFAPVSHASGITRATMRTRTAEKKRETGGWSAGTGRRRRRRATVLHLRNRNLDEVEMQRNDDDEEGVPGTGGSAETVSNFDDSDAIIISRRELIAALLSTASIAGFVLAGQRSTSIRRWSFQTFRGILKERFPPASSSSVAIARFMIDGMQNGPAADLTQLNWVNVPQPRLKDRLLIVHLWRQSDVQTPTTVSVLEDVVAQMKEELSGVVATIGVHCAKFDNEMRLAAVKDAAEELRLRHAIAADVDLRLWKSIGAEQWPTVLILSPNEHRVLVALTGRLFVLDSGNSRVLVTTLEGKFLMQIGGGVLTDPLESEGRRHFLYAEGENDGFRDGSFEETLFRNPQGLAFNSVSNELAVADTGNNCLRVANFETRTVRSVLFDSSDEKQAQANKITLPHRPWDVAVAAGNLYTTLAGSHTIWRLDAFGDLGIFCGMVGVCGHSDVDSGYSGATFAMPTGICCTKEAIFVADSDSSTIREIGVVSKSVRTVVGGDPIFLSNLSVFGDRDGYGTSARLQRPMGLCPFPDDKLLVADCYNHKIRVISPEENECRLFSGAGTSGYKDGSRETARFSSPSGVAYHEKLQVAFVADKNNNCIRIVDGVSGSVSTMKFFGFPDFGEVPIAPQKH